MKITALFLALVLLTPMLASAKDVTVPVGQDSKWIGAGIATGAIFLLTMHHAVVGKAVVKTVAAPGKALAHVWKSPNHKSVINTNKKK